MDTGTHIVMGFGLAGLAHIDPLVASNPALAAAVMVGTVVGSNAPDFDGLVRLKSNASYIKNHRGLSHSFPAIAGWAFMISGLAAFLVPQVSWSSRLFFWTLIAVFIHVGIDLFNAYGTQMLRPLSKKWISFNIINIFDPYIFGLFITGLVAWVAGLHPGYVFSVVYTVFIFYIILRTFAHYRVKRKVREITRLSGTYTVIPTFSWGHWGVIVETEDTWQVGEWKDGAFVWHDHFTKPEESLLIRKSKEISDVKAFLSFTNYAHVQTLKNSQGYEVRWFDLRYRLRSHYRFVAIVHFDHGMNSLFSYTGWSYRPHKTEKECSLQNPV